MFEFKERWPWILLALAVFMSTLYEYGYWSTFQFNAFEYFSIEALIKNFAYVVISGFAPSVLCLLVNLVPSIIREYKGEESSYSLIEDFEENYPKAKLTFELFAVAMFFFVTVYIGSYSKLQDIPSWIVMIDLGLLSLYIALDDNYKIFGKRQIRGLVLYFVGFYCWVAVSTGRKEAIAILRGHNCFYVNLSPGEQKDLGAKQAKYIGALGDSYAFVTVDNKKTFLVTKEHMPALRLERSNKKRGLPRLH
ncbi:hypothetical protein LGH70_19625 [Hymenobacter sp. BT635]|uniref:Uncharacterized protein n=1 Tax=Hymenobacter nitidus TaxID=2880929 RepID=A0ABS8AHS4_9BACT|nr:hypothetical protein [Hymenobacter nitidus]MCB2379816.1 hypothetical protein [Hymenobacter nitidus]